MIEQPMKVKTAILQFFQRLIAVKSEDEQAARLGRLFNTLMLVSLFFSLLFFVTYLLAGELGLFIKPGDKWLQSAFALSFIPLGLFCWFQVKRGYVRSTFTFYIWLCFFCVSLAIFLFGGLASPLWSLYFWPLGLAAIFLSPLYVLGLTGGVLGYFMLLFLLTQFGGYVPLVAISRQLFWFTGQSLILMLLSAVAGIMNYLNMQGVQAAFMRLRRKTQSLEETRQELESRVDARMDVLQTRAEQFQAIAELSHMTASILNMQQLLDTTVRLISERLGFYHVGVFIIDPNGEWAILQAASSEGGQRMLARGHRLRVGQQGIVGYVSQTGLPRFAFSVGEDAIWFNNPDLPETQSEMALPLIAREQRIGVLDIQTREDAAFTDEDVAVLRILADNIAVAIFNTRLWEETRGAVDRLSRYQEQDALQAWRQALTRRNMRLDYVYDSGLVSRLRPDDVTASVAGRAVVDDVTTRVLEDGHHLLLAPVNIRGQKLGTLSFEQMQPWSTEQIQFTRFVVEQLELALDNARLLEETNLRANQQRARSEIMARVRILGSTDAIMRGAVEELGRALQVERSRIQLLPPGEDEI